MQPRHFFHLIITYPFAVNFQRKRRCNAVRPLALKIFQFPIFSCWSRLTRRIIERVKIVWLRCVDRERRRSSREKGARLYLEIDYPGQRGWHLHCVSSALLVRASRRFLGSLDFNGQASLPRSKGAPLTRRFLERRRRETGCDKMENSNSIVAQTCKIIRHSLSRSRGSIRVANYTVLSRDIGDIKTQKKRERERGAHTILSYSPAMYRFPRTKTYDGWRVYRLTNSNGV